MIRIGNIDITGIYVGSTPITKVYLGETLLWSAAAAPSYDADAEAGFTAAGITDTTRKDKINTLIVGLKAAGVWARLTGLYLTNQGSASANAVNWKSPGTYDLTFIGSPLHQAHSIQWNGTNQYANTGINLDATFDDGYGHLAYYSTTDSSEVSAWDIGCYENARSRRAAIRLRQQTQGVTVMFFANTTTVDNRNYNMASTARLVIGNISANNITMFKDATELTSVGTSSAGAGHPNVPVTLGGALRDTGTVDGYSTKACAAASVGLDLTPTQAVDYSNLLMTYITETNL